MNYNPAHISNRSDAEISSYRKASVERQNYDGLGPVLGPYSHVVRANGFVFTSGLTAFGTPSQDGSVSEQIDAIFAQLSAIAKAENTSLKNLVKVTVFVTSLDCIQSIRNSLERNYCGVFPASSLLQVVGFAAPVKVEIEAVFAF